ncbi:MAG: nicotinamide-nucleotide amidohydrolase family protein, partial [Chloroflexi bacterium]|nr:nicotinamide-nucleotide amidohydrolase family protein [Chloroflexota bacterium]
DHILVTMPGVPFEMERMWRDQALPRLRARLGGEIIVTRTFKTVGIGESRAEELVSHLIHSFNPSLATYAKRDGVHLRVAAKAATEAQARAMIADLEARVREVIGPYIYGVDDETLESALGQLFRERGLTLATMESCTGGLLASTITDAPGSSAYFRGGMVAYAIAAKEQWGVDPAIIKEYGVVSPQVAAAMATAARREVGADVGLGITGVAGPDPLDGQPPGTLYLGLDIQGQVDTFSGFYGSERRQVKRVAVLYALGFLRRKLLELEGTVPVDGRLSK